MAYLGTTYNSVKLAPKSKGGEKESWQEYQSQITKSLRSDMELGFYWGTVGAIEGF